MKSGWQWYWRKNESGEADCGVFYEKLPGHAYAVARCPRYVAEDEWRKTAPLIAAAPDLLAALEAAYGHMMNASIDLETNRTKAIAIKTLKSGLAIVDAALKAARSEAKQAEGGA